MLAATRPTLGIDPSGFRVYCLELRVYYMVFMLQTICILLDLGLGATQGIRIPGYEQEA